MAGYAVFETAIGWCGLAWSERGVIGSRLPEADEAQTRARLARRFPNAAPAEPPAEIAEVIGAIVGLLASGEGDLSSAPLDMTGQPPLFQRIFEAARAIPAGETRTYGDLAKAIGEPGAAQTVGQAMGKNPFPILVPCHRVLGAGGKLVGFSAPGGLATKLRLLEIEGARVAEPPSLFDDLPLQVAPPRR